MVAESLQNLRTWIVGLVAEVEVEGEFEIEAGKLLMIAVPFRVVAVVHCQNLQKLSTTTQAVHRVSCRFSIKNSVLK